MTLKEFTVITLNIVANGGGIESYAPTLIFSEKEEVQVIEGIPDDVAHTEAIQEVVLRSGMENTEFFFGVRSGDKQITTGHYCPGKQTIFMLIREISGSYSIESLASCRWWTVVPSTSMAD